MSRHWHNLRIAQIGEAKSISDLLHELEQRDPSLAHELANIDWLGVRKHVMHQALEDAARELQTNLSDSFDNSSVYGSQSGRPPRGECVGVLQEGAFFQLGVSIEEDGRLNFFWNQGGDEVNGRTLEQWKQAVEQCFAIRLIQATVELCSDEMHTSTLEDGTFVVVGTRN